MTAVINRCKSLWIKASAKCPNCNCNWWWKHLKTYSESVNSRPKGLHPSLWLIAHNGSCLKMIIQYWFCAAGSSSTELVDTSRHLTALNVITQLSVRADKKKHPSLRSTCTNVGVAIILNKIVLVLGQLSCLLEAFIWMVEANLEESTFSVSRHGY